MMTTDYVAESLRTIGEDLEFRGIKTLSIRCGEDLFVVDGGYQEPPAPMPVTLYYGHEDIAELKRKGRERGDHLSPRTSFIYLPEILLAIGRYVDEKGGELLSLSNLVSTIAERAIEVEYESQQRARVVERLTSADIYSLCIRGHKRREREQIGTSRFRQFSSLAERSPAR